MGQGSPTIILTAGLGESGENWRTIMPQLAQQTRVCAWDRAGMGFSDPTTLAQDAGHTTGDLEQTLRSARIRGPYVMAGHSIGSFETLLFTYRHPAQVAGMVLVDPSSPYQNRIFTEASPKFGALNRQRMAERQSGMRKCISALQAGHLDAPECGPAEPNRSAAQRIGVAHSIQSMGEEMAENSSSQLVAARRPLGKLPLIVLTAGKPFTMPDDLASEGPRVRAAWVRMHDELAAQSARGENRIVEGSAHYIHVDRPEAVISAVREVVAAARAQAGKRRR